MTLFQFPELEDTVWLGQFLRRRLQTSLRLGAYGDESGAPLWGQSNQERKMTLIVLKVVG